MAPSNWPLRVVGAGILIVWAAYAVARTGVERLRTLPVNVILLGVIVPPGRQRVELEVSNTPEIAAGAVALAAALAALRNRPRWTLPGNP